MSPEHDNNLQPTLDMSASESSADAPQAAPSQAKASQGTGAATAAARALETTPSTAAVEESAGISVSTDGHGASGTIAPVSGTEENSTQATEAHDVLPDVSGDTHRDGAGAEISEEMTTGVEAAESSETMDQLLDQFPTPEPAVTEGEIFDGRVLAVTDAGVIVDVGGKFEGLVPAQEF
ncbi:MAG TPA: S1 RNA-binding domain-containing protein, partial [Candidatus Acidoferrales bacterium]|nr:S1 RNA-binding domain-containing protein [Candidatus Acidoferrales bacterium]